MMCAVLQQVQNTGHRSQVIVLLGQKVYPKHSQKLTLGLKASVWA